jgi:formate hydrogenlyase subunit 3/multisubunit Na+/H+ antiporter MnhD subunit
MVWLFLPTCFILYCFGNDDPFLLLPGVFENNSPAKLKAGFTYFVVTQATSVGLIFASAILYSYTGTLRLSELPYCFRVGPELSAQLHLILALFFIGFGAKAGVFPLGFWMPEAYAAAPASATAVFSGVMSKMGVYGILRIFVWLLPAADIASTWGLILATFGVLSMLVGNLRTLPETDSKRLLAQSSIGQMGYILLGIGAGLYFRTSAPFLSVLALVGAIFHVLNHGFFKSLVFFKQGSIFYRTGTNDLNKVGGLAKLMPAACAVGLVGSLAISGMPPFNGFMSKWLLYQASIFGGITVPVFALYGIIAIFISTVSLAAYLKYMGTAYLGILPHKFSAGPKGQPFSMEAVQAVLAAGCVLLGLFPGRLSKSFTMSLPARRRLAELHKLDRC